MWRRRVCFDLPQLDVGGSANEETAKMTAVETLLLFVHQKEKRL